MTWSGSGEPYSIEEFGSFQPAQNAVRITQSAVRRSSARRDPRSLARPGSISMKYVAGSSSGNIQ